MTPIQKAKEIAVSVLNFLEHAQFDKDIIETIADAYSKSPQAAALLSGEDWISVEAEKPGHNQIVDAYDGKNRRCQYDAETKQFYRHTDFCDGDRLMRPYYPNVTHWKWIDFPEPPKP